MNSEIVDCEGEKVKAKGGSYHVCSLLFSNGTLYPDRIECTTKDFEII